MHQKVRAPPRSQPSFQSPAEAPLSGRPEQGGTSNHEELVNMRERADRSGHHFENIPSARTATTARGQPLPAALSQKMGQALGHDFSDVRVQESPEPAAMGAIAFTRGSELHFAPGRYEPSTSEGQRVLGHELAHVVQQRQGRVSPVHRLGGQASNMQSHLELEADAAGARAALGHATALGSHGGATSAPPSHSPAVVQPLRDKLAFDNLSGDESLGDEHREVSSRIDALVKEHKERLRAAKKERVAGWEEELRRIADVPDEKERNRQVKAAHQSFLNDYKGIGWDKQELQNHITQRLGEGGHELSVDGNEFKHKGKTVYRIHEGDDRFKPVDLADDTLKQNVYQKIGTKKHYVKDARNTFVPRYARRAITENERKNLTNEEGPNPLRPRDPSTTLSERAERLFGVPEDLAPGAELTNEQLEFLQNRDGTAAQKLLSATHTKHKIFGNHGYSFDNAVAPPEGLEYGGSVFIDMAKMKSMHILNQHLAETQTKKADAFKGWGKRDKNSLKELTKRKMRARGGADQELVTQWEEAQQAVKDASPDIKKHELKKLNSTAKGAELALNTRIKLLLGQGADPGAATTSEDELREGDASAIRNRETHFKKIPVRAIVKRLEPGDRNVEEQYAQFLKERHGE